MAGMTEGDNRLVPLPTLVPCVASRYWSQGKAGPPQHQCTNLPAARLALIAPLFDSLSSDQHSAAPRQNMAYLGSGLYASPMSLMTLLDFVHAVEQAENLLSIHEDIRTGPGRRYREVSLNRAAVVLAVAAWQAGVENDVDYRLGQMKPSLDGYDGQTDPKYRAALAQWRVLNAGTKNALRRYSSPTAEQTQALYLSVGYDPYPQWHWSTRGQPVTLETAITTLDAWVKVRNHIAHGNPSMPEVSVLSRTTKRKPTLRKKDAQSCIAFLQQLAKVT